MKKFLFFIVICLGLIAAVSFFLKPAILFVARRQIQNAISGSTVFVQDCQWNIFSRLELIGIEVKHPDSYHVTIGRAGLYYRLPSLWKGRILKLRLNDVSASGDFSHQSAFLGNASVGQKGRSGMRLERVEVLHSDWDLEFMGLRFVGKISADVDLLRRRLLSLNANVDSLEGQTIFIKQGLIRIAEGQPGEVLIQRLEYGKFKINDISSPARLSGDTLFLEPFFAKTFEGTVKGKMMFVMEKALAYRAALIFQGLDLAGMANDFDLEEKVHITGMMNGEITVAGSGSKMKIINGSFSAVDPGGMLVIKDNEFLKNIARRSNQSLDIVIESFKNYHYNVGQLRLSLEEDRVIFDMAFDGAAGKRDIYITLHTMNSTKE